MSKPKMYGTMKPFTPNSKADQMKKRFKRKAQKRKAVKKV